jgi:hypothetical protein
MKPNEINWEEFFRRLELAIPIVLKEDLQLFKELAKY